MTQKTSIEMTIFDHYEVAAKEHCNTWNVSSVHVKDICKSAMMDRDGVLPGGGFINAVNSNNLREAVNRADEECLQNIKVIVAAFRNKYINQSVLDEYFSERNRMGV
jgi:hypothetical protein